MAQNPRELPQLKSSVDGEEFLGDMSAPRVDPARLEMTGWAMKENRKQQRNEKDHAMDVG